MYILQLSIRMLITLFAGLILLVAPLQTSEDNVTYHVKPSQSGHQNCQHNHPCITFKQFLNDSDLHPENIVLVFAKGYHSQPEIEHNYYTVANKNLTMRGTSKNVTIYCINVLFNKIQKLQIENLTLSSSHFLIIGDKADVTAKLELLSILSLNDSALNIIDTALTELNSCTFSNGTNPLTIYI